MRPVVQRVTFCFRLLLALLILTTSATFAAELRFSSLTDEDWRQMEFQRRVARELVMRHLGQELKGDELSDLGLLQRLLDGGAVDPNSTFELQSLGVALGDVMAARLRLSWVIVEDEAGRNRALQLGETNLVTFPVTMISTRVQADLPTDVRKLFDEASERIEAYKKKGQASVSE